MSAPQPVSHSNSTIPLSNPLVSGGISERPQGDRVSAAFLRTNPLHSRRQFTTLPERIEYIEAENKLLRNQVHRMYGLIRAVVNWINQVDVQNIQRNNQEVFLLPPREISSYYFEDAFRFFRQGQHEIAYQNISTAIRLVPNNLEFRALRVQVSQHEPFNNSNSYLEDLNILIQNNHNQDVFPYQRLKLLYYVKLGQEENAVEILNIILQSTDSKNEEIEHLKDAIRELRRIHSQRQSD